MGLLEVIKFVKRALEASVYVAPKEPGLSKRELIETGSRHRLAAGEIEDAIRGSGAEYDGMTYTLDRASAQNLIEFSREWDGDPRNLEAFEFVLNTFEQLVRKEGATRAAIDRSVLVAQASSQNLVEHDVEVAITAYLSNGVLEERGDGTLRRHRVYASPCSQRMQRSTTIERDSLVEVIPTVRDVIARRSDGRYPKSEPTQAFASFLGKTKNSQYMLWWEHTRNELARADAGLMPTCVTLLAAALAEGALTFIGQEVRKTGESMTGTTLEKELKHWKFQDLTKEAKRGSRPILSDTLAKRCDELNENRQRIHVGRFLQAQTPPKKLDIRPEEARAAKETLDQLLRAILDWFALRPNT